MGISVEVLLRSRTAVLVPQRIKQQRSDCDFSKIFMHHHDEISFQKKSLIDKKWGSENSFVKKIEYLRLLPSVHR